MSQALYAFPNPRRLAIQGVHTFIRKVHSQLTLTNTNDQDGSLMFFQLYQLPNYSDFTNLFNEFKINKISVQFIPRVTSHGITDVESTDPAVVALLATYVDKNDLTSPASMNEIYENQNCKVTRGSQMHTRTFVPHVRLEGPDATSASYAITNKNCWINVDNKEVYWLGLKYWYQATKAATEDSIVFDVIKTFYISCRQSR